MRSETTAPAACNPNWTVARALIDAGYDTSDIGAINVSVGPRRELDPLVVCIFDSDRSLLVEVPLPASAWGQLSLLEIGWIAAYLPETPIRMN
jgi:hypothetical protein